MLRYCIGESLFIISEPDICTDSLQAVYKKAPELYVRGGSISITPTFAEALSECERAIITYRVVWTMVRSTFARLGFPIGFAHRGLQLT